MARKRYVYLLERISESLQWPRGIRIWADAPCVGWRVIEKIEVK